MSGLIDTAYVSTSNPGANADTKGVGQNGSATTVLTIAGSEDLGGGLRANFQLQLTPDFINGAGVEGTSVAGVSGATGRSVGTGQQAFVGLSSNSLGTLRVGRVNSPALDAWSVGSVFGTAIGSGFGSSGNIYTRYSVASATSVVQSAPVRFNGAVRYDTRTINGFTASVLMVPKNNSSTSAGAGQSVTDIGLRYAAGALTAMISQQTIEQTGASDDTRAFMPTSGTGALTAGTENKLTTLAASYNVNKDLRLLGAKWSEKQNTATPVDVSGYMLGARYVMGKTTLMASMGRSNDQTSANVDRKIVGVGADYSLSPRTALYARYDSRDNNTNNATDDTTNGTTKRAAVGIRHTF